MTKASYGLTSWTEKNATQKGGGQQKQDSTRIPFVRLKEGNNILRIITDPYKYWQVKFLDGKSQFGTRVYCAFPAVDKDQCPTVQAGYKPKKRYMVGVIHRDGDAGNAVKILDMSVLVYEQLQSFMEDPEVGPSTGYDINVRFNPKASSAQGFYSVIPRAKSNLSQADTELVGSVGMPVVEENLIRLTTPPSAERVRERLMKLGWDGSTAAVAEVGTKSSGSEFEESSDNDYSFDRPN